MQRRDATLINSDFASTPCSNFPIELFTIDVINSYPILVHEDYRMEIMLCLHILFNLCRDW